MTQEEIIELWKKANGWDVKDYQNTLDDLMRFAKLVAEKEREACANLVDENASRCGVDTIAWVLLSSNAQAIRARGQA